MAPRPTFPPFNPAPGPAPGARAKAVPMPSAPRFQDLDLTHHSRAGRPVQAASKAHCIGRLVCGPGPGTVLQVESRLERKEALVWLARSDTAEIEEHVPFVWQDAHGHRRTHYFDLRVTRITTPPWR